MSHALPPAPVRLCAWLAACAWLLLSLPARGAEPSPAVLEALRNAEAAVQTRKFDQALGLLNKAISLDGGYAPAYYRRALLYAAGNRPNEALADCDKAMTLTPADTSLYDLRARIYLLGYQDPMSAIRDYGKALTTPQDIR